MAIIRKQYRGIKFPFTSNNLRGFFLDLNDSLEDKVISEILHVILTPKGTRIRMPEFGTNLAKYIFEPNDEITWDNVKNETINSVKRYVDNTELTSIDVLMKDDDDNKIFLVLAYSVIRGKNIENNKAIIEL